ncbi:protein Iojap, chloroplastic [Phoenix dactylifera]|uniref:Protein Iojap, chloroplastic n=1 Tax=Phoenix dactylifera TaxID=42345 RepID=A0A8B7CCU2_PHODC|nr:protein Iojap, chloroplastic [Phoenix dactylifera]XP_026662491.1 protein Iojap, chloroplastic [Phoenix dactylifera]
MRALATAAAIPSCVQFHDYSQEPVHGLGLRRRRRCYPCARVPSSSRTTRFQVFLSQRPPDHNVRGRDTDEMFDDLLKKYGKVVYGSGDRQPPSAESDDDAVSLSFAVTLAKVADEVKAADIRVLFVKPLVYWTRFFIIVTAFSRPQIDAIGSRIRDIAEKQFNKVASGDTKPNSWTLLDFGDVVVHIFLPQQRAFYNLEEFYGNATPIELPFDNQSQFRS